MCAPCHGTLGDGDSITARDMVLRPPPSLLTPLVREYTDQRLYDVISRGYGLMPAYSYQLAPRDRWAVVHYVRVLQHRQEVPLAELSSSEREEALRWLR
jgi:mono/diheme cytochrome c family protein